MCHVSHRVVDGLLVLAEPLEVIMSPNLENMNTVNALVLISVVTLVLRHTAKVRLYIMFEMTLL